jgi:glyoxylase-like metal-dependent hydrolase (beta-lactamase superfamily II)
MPMRSLPPITGIFPANDPRAIRLFWIKYWAWFFALLPWMLLRQVGISLGHAAGVLCTWNRQIHLLGGSLRLLFMNSLPSFMLTTVFGERFTAIHFRDVLIDPGPRFARSRLRRYFEEAHPRITAIVATHAHEEHAGNAPLASKLSKARIYGSEYTLQAIRDPERLSLPRRIFIGQPEPASSLDLRTLPTILTTPDATLEVIQSPGHCHGHASLFDRDLGILFAGDSFLHTIFTAPNREASAAERIRTLEDYLQLDIRTMVGTHGLVYTADERIAPMRFVVQRRDPRQMISDKLDFMKWAQDVVAEGERRNLPYSVIEACLFPWQRRWAWQTWFTDEGGRLFSAGEFSRTYFVRSLSRTPEKVPARFPPFARLVNRLRPKGRVQDA